MARVIVVADSPYFRSDSFNVYLKDKKIKAVHFKDVPENRPFEFAEFILAKSTDLQEASSWFGSVYQEKARWSLPDGSEGVLFQRAVKPWKVPDMGIFNLTLDEFKMPNILAKDVVIHAVPLSAKDSAVGRFKELSLKSKSLVYKDIQAENVTVRFIRPQVNLPLFMETQEIQLLSLDRLKLNGEIAPDAVLPLIQAKVKWLKEPFLEFAAQSLIIGGKMMGVPLRIIFTADVDAAALHLRAKKIFIAHFSIPIVFFRFWIDQTVPLTPNKDMPFHLDLAGVEIQQGSLKLVAVP